MTSSSYYASQYTAARGDYTALIMVLTPLTIIAIFLIIWGTYKFINARREARREKEIAAQQGIVALAEYIAARAWSSYQPASAEQDERLAG